MSYLKWIFTALLFLCTVYGHPSVSQGAGLWFSDKSVILIRSVRQDFDYVAPWKMERMPQSVGSGLITADKKILTNAHNVSNCRYVKLAKENLAKTLPDQNSICRARVRSIPAHGR